MSPINPPYQVASELIQDNVTKNHDLWKGFLFTLMLNLVGVISKSVRGITLNFDGETIQILVVFDKEPLDEEISDFQDVEAEMVATHKYMSDLQVTSVDPADDISHLVKNWGWAYLRKEN